MSDAVSKAHRARVQVAVAPRGAVLVLMTGELGYRRVEIFREVLCRIPRAALPAVPCDRAGFGNEALTLCEARQTALTPPSRGRLTIGEEPSPGTPTSGRRNGL